MKLAELKVRKVYGKCGLGEPQFTDQKHKQVSEKQRRYLERRKIQLMGGRYVGSEAVGNNGIL